MKKNSKENDLDQQQQNLDPENPQSSRFSGRSCSSALSRLFGLRCLIVLVLSLTILLSAIFCLFPRRSVSEVDGDDTIKLNATVQAYFRLKRPASEVASHKGRLEDDIFRSLRLSNTNVTVLSLHQSGASNYTDVKFAVLPVSTDHAISKHSLKTLRSSFVKLFAKRAKLNLNTTSFGKPTSFQVLKFPGGISVDPLGSIPVSGDRVVNLLDFKLDYSISKIRDSLAQQLNGQLESTLCLDPYESIQYQLTNKKGSTVSPPVTIRVYVVLTSTYHLQERLDHFAQTIQTSRDKNLGLDNAVFGEVKSITFSTYLEDHALVLAPTPSS